MRVLIKIILLSLIFISCEDIIEQDITDDYVQIISPQRGDSIFSNAVNFRWQEIDGADDYRIQIYSSNQSMMIDSLVSGGDASFPLNPGNYQWRVRGENFSYETAYSFPASFSVISTPDLTNQQVFLSNPSDAIFTNNSVIDFVWQELSAAASYDFQLLNITNGQSVVFTQNDIMDNSLTISASVINNINAEYQWKVRAKNESGQTQYSVRSFKYDNIAPNQPQNSGPLNETTVSLGATVNFTWTAPTDSGIIQSPISYTIEFSNDNTFSSIIQTSTASVNSLQRVFNLEGDYYWRVKAQDTAGNIGAYSVFSRVTVN